MIAKGGKQVYGAPIGILMLEAQFPRIPGDMGNATTWPFPVLYKVVTGASPDLVVRRGAKGMLEPFIEAGHDLICQGAELITTNCGFLALFQKELSATLDVPVAATALLQVPMVQAILPPGKRPGIITISADSLTPAHLEGAGCPLDIPVVGTDPEGAFASAILGDHLQMDIAAAREDLLSAGQHMVHDHPNVGAIVLECTNMPPYQKDISLETGLPVFSIVDYVCWLYSGLRPREFG